MGSFTRRLAIAVLAIAAIWLVHSTVHLHLIQDVTPYRLFDFNLEAGAQDSEEEEDEEEYDDQEAPRPRVARTAEVEEDGEYERHDPPTPPPPTPRRGVSDEDEPAPPPEEEEGGEHREGQEHRDREERDGREESGEREGHREHRDGPASDASEGWTEADAESQKHADVPEIVDSPRAPKAIKTEISSCPKAKKSKSKWIQAPSFYLKHIEKYGDASAVTDCHRHGNALVFRLRLQAARRVRGNAYEMPFPDYIVADEGPLGDGSVEEDPLRRKRSTLQLFSLGRKGPKPMGPAHAEFDTIAERGGGAFSHYRDNILSGPHGRAHLRFSTPGNVELDELEGIVAIAFPMLPPLGWIEFTHGKRKKHQEVFRELFFRTFPTVGAEPHVITEAKEVKPGTWYLWRIGGNHEFGLPLKQGEIYEKRLPYQIAEWYGEFAKQGAHLFPPPETYVFYQNKVALAELFQRTGVNTPLTWVFRSAEEAVDKVDEITFPAVIKDPYGFSSHGIRQAKNAEEFKEQIHDFFADVGAGMEAIVQSKVVALKEARVSYIDGRPFHAYWRIRKSLESASAASNLGGFQSFDFPLPAIAEATAKFAEQTGVPVGGVDWIWKEADPDIRTSEAFTLEVSPTSDLNPPQPKSWTKTYAEFKETDGYRPAYLAVRRVWSELMTIAVIDRHRRGKRHLFVGVDNTVCLSAQRLKAHKGTLKAYAAREVMKDKPMPKAASVLAKLRNRFFVRFLTDRGNLYEDAFNVTQTWLNSHGFLYDDLIVVNSAEDKLAHLTPDAILVDDLRLSSETERPRKDEKLIAKLESLKLPYIVFPADSDWKRMMPKLWREGSPGPDGK